MTRLCQHPGCRSPLVGSETLCGKHAPGEDVSESVLSEAARCAKCEEPLDDDNIDVSSEECGLCRKSPADGWAFIGDRWERIKHRRPGLVAVAVPDDLLLPTESESVLSEAARLVDGDRQAAYGHPAKNHGCTAELWTAYLRRRCSATKTIEIGEPVVNIIELDAFDVCMLNILQKVSRLAHSRHRDGLVDLAGFAANADMVDER